MIRRRLSWSSVNMTLAMLVAATLVALIAFGFVGNQKALIEENKTARDARAAATRRIDILTSQIKTLESQAIENGKRIAELSADIDALSGQIRQDGHTPVVTITNTPTTTTRPQNRPTQSSVSPANTSPGTTTPPKSTPTTTTTTRPLLPCVPRVTC